MSVREIEHLGDDLNSKFRSEVMKGGRSELMTQTVAKSVILIRITQLDMLKVRLKLIVRK